MKRRNFIGTVLGGLVAAVTVNKLDKPKWKHLDTRWDLSKGVHFNGKEDYLKREDSLTYGDSKKGSVIYTSDREIYIKVRQTNPEDRVYVVPKKNG